MTNSSRMWLTVLAAVVLTVALGFLWGAGGWATGVVISLGLVADAVVRPTWAERRASVIALGRAVLVAIPFAGVSAFVGVLIVLALVVPGAGLFAHVPAMMLNTGALLVTVVGTVAGIVGFRRPTPRAIDRWSRLHGVPASMTATATVELQRLRAYRTAPAVVGYSVGSMSAPAGYVAQTVLGPQHPSSQALSNAAFEQWWALLAPLLAPLLALVGYIIGVVLAEVTRRPPVDGGAGARLETRRPEQYLTRTAQWLPPLLAGWVVVASVAGALAGRVSDWRLALIAATLPVAVAVVQRYIVRRPQPVTDLDALALDDTLRSSAAHALSGSISALLLTWAIVATQSAVFGATGTLGAAWFVPAAVGSLGACGLWAYYGSAHRGRRPRRRDVTRSVEAIGT